MGIRISGGVLIGLACIWIMLPANALGLEDECGNYYT